MSFFLLFGILNIVSYLVIIATWIILNDHMTMNLILSGLTVLSSVVIVLMNKEKFSGLYETEFFKKLSSEMISLILIFFILGLVNFLSFKNPYKYDTSAFKITTLSAQTQSVLSSIKEPIELKVFARKNTFGVIQKLLELYRFENSQISFTFIDAELSAPLVKKYSISKVPSIVFPKGEGNFLTITKITELSLTNAFIKVTRESDPHFYFTVGHGEIILDSTSADSGSAFKDLLERNSFEVRSINLAQIEKIPTEAHTLVIWGAKSSFFEIEIQKIKDFVKNGGNLILALDPDFNDKTQSLRSLAREYGIEIHNNVVIDQLKHINGSSGSVPLVSRFNREHPVVRDYEGELFFPVVSSISSVEGSPYEKEIREMLLTSPFPAAWGESDLEQFIGGQSQFNEGKDLKGPLSLASSLEFKSGNKLAVIGNSIFVSNTYKKFSSNFIFALNLFSWIGDEGRLIAFNLPELKDEPIFMSGDQKSVIFYFSVLFIPLLMIIFSIIVFLRGKRL